MALLKRPLFFYLGVAEQNTIRVPPVPVDLLRISQSCEQLVRVVRVKRHPFKFISKIKRLQYQWWIQNFPEGGANSKSGCVTLLFCKLFAENCMKMKEFGPRGAHVPGVPPWIHHWIVVTCCDERFLY